MDISAWRTDAGHVGILIGLPTRSGGRASYDQLVQRADHHIIGATRVDVGALEDVTASKGRFNRPKDHETLDELRPSATTSKRQTATPERSSPARPRPRPVRSPIAGCPPREKLAGDL